MLYLLHLWILPCRGLQSCYNYYPFSNMLTNPLVVLHATYNTSGGLHFLFTVCSTVHSFITSVMRMKQPRLQDFLTKRRIKAGLFPNPDHKTKQIRIRTWYMQNKNPTKVHCKQKIKTKQGYDQKKNPKLVFNKLKVMKNSTSIYTHWAPSSRKFLNF